MINIYDYDPYISITSLLSGSILEIAQYAASFLICSLYFRAVKRFLNGSLKKAAVVILPALHIFYVYSAGIKREFIFSLSLAILITLQLRILQLLPFQAEDYMLLLCLTLFPNRLFNNTSALIGYLLLPCLCLAVLYAQLPFIVLLFKAAFYKDAATYQQWEKEEISSYYQTLSSSLSDMQGMRHDIKNIFFTMGNFVNESNNQIGRASCRERV